MVGMGAHLVEDISNQFHLPHDDGVGVERAELEDARQRLSEAGYILKPAANAAWSKFTMMRVIYASLLNSMARAWATHPAQWIVVRSAQRIVLHTISGG